MKSRSYQCGYYWSLPRDRLLKTMRIQNWWDCGLVLRILHRVGRILMPVVCFVDPHAICQFFSSPYLTITCMIGDVILIKNFLIIQLMKQKAT